MDRLGSSEPPGIFIKQDAIKSHLSAHINDGAPTCFVGTLQVADGEAFLVAATGPRYLALRRGADPNVLVRHLRTALPMLREMDGGGYQICNGFAVLLVTLTDTSATDSSARWALVNVQVARELLRLVDEAFMTTRPSRPPTAPLMTPTPSPQ